MKTKARGFILGLTGGMGSGKSEVLAIFSALGARTFCVDRAAHALLRKGAPGYRRVLKAFGSKILDSHGEIDRRALGHIVFSDKKMRLRLERMTHPEILRQMRQAMRAHKKGLLIVAVPLLFESRLEDDFDAVMVVTAPQDLCVRRVLKRGGLSALEALRRMKAQMPLPEKEAKADIVVDNSRTKNQLQKRIKEYHHAFELMCGGK